MVPTGTIFQFAFRRVGETLVSSFVSNFVLNFVSYGLFRFHNCVERKRTFLDTLRFQASGDAEIKTVPRHFARANQADHCITLVHCAQRLTP